MLFLLPIPVSLVLAIAWCAWVSRPPRPADAIDSVAEYRRALEILAPVVTADRAAPTRDRELAHSR